MSNIIDRGTDGVDAQRVTFRDGDPVISGGISDGFSEALAAGGGGRTTSVAITRPSNTTGYGAGDVIGVADSGTPANAGSAIHTFALAGPTDGHILITDARLRIDLAAVPSGMTSFRLHLYNASPDAILDNAVWDLSSSGDRGKYLGYIDLGTPVDLGSTLFVQQTSLQKLVKLSGTSLYGQLQTIGTYTPASGTVYTVALQTVAV